MLDTDREKIGYAAWGIGSILKCIIQFITAFVIIYK